MTLNIGKDYHCEEIKKELKSKFHLLSKRFLFSVSWLAIVKFNIRDVIGFILVLHNIQFWSNEKCHQCRIKSLYYWQFIGKRNLYKGNEEFPKPYRAEKGRYHLMYLDPNTFFMNITEVCNIIIKVQPLKEYSCCSAIQIPN